MLVRLAPGGPFDQDRAAPSPAIEKKIQEKYHLDEPLWKQYARFLGGLIRGDLGPSLKYRNHSVNEMIAQGLPVSLLLGAVAFLFALGIGLPVGVYSGLRKGQLEDFAGSFFALVFICIPAFVIGPLLVMFFAIKLRWLPVGLWGGPSHVILPAATLGLYFAGRVARLMKEGMLTTLNAGFVRTARAKGLTEREILFRHILPIAILPVVSYSGPLLAELLTGSFVVENLFQIPGIGVFMVNGSLNRDYTLVVGLVVLYAVLLMSLNLVVDFLYAWLDPRVKYE